MNYLLIDPKLKDVDNDMPNIKISTCEAMLENKGHNVYIFELFSKDFIDEETNLEKFKIYKECYLYNSIKNNLNNIDVVYIDCEYGLLKECLNISKSIKNYNKDITIAVGGTFINYLHEGNFLEDISNEIKSIDYYLIGDYINSLNEIEEVKYNSSKIINRDSSDYNHKQLKVSWEKFKLASYNNLNVPIFFSKGCAYNKCTFCDERLIWGNDKYICRKVEDVIDEVKYNYNKYNIKQYYIWDASIVSHPDFKNICERISSLDIDINWIGLSRIDDLTEETIQCLKQSNCRAIEIGIEVLDDSTLKYTSKGITMDKAYSTIEKLKNTGIDIEGSFIIGLPSDDEQNINNRIKLARELELDYYRWHNYQIPARDLQKNELNISFKEWIELDLNVPNHLLKHSLKDNRLGYFDMHIADKTYNFKLEQYPNINIGELSIQQIIELTYKAIEETNVNIDANALHSPFI